jgi:hypothetical protein
VSQQVSERIKGGVVRTCHGQGITSHACMCERGEMAHVALVLDNAMPCDDVFDRELDMQGVAGHALHCTEGKAPWEREKGRRRRWTYHGGAPPAKTIAVASGAGFRRDDNACLSLGLICGCFGSTHRGYPIGATVYLWSWALGRHAPRMETLRRIL